MQHWQNLIEYSIRSFQSRGTGAEEQWVSLLPSAPSDKVPKQVEAFLDMGDESLADEEYAALMEETQAKVEKVQWVLQQ